MTQSDQTPNWPNWPPISQLEYGFTKNLGNFQSEELSVRLNVPVDSNPDVVLQDARDWVEGHLAIDDDTYEAKRSEYAFLKRETARLDEQVADLKSRYATVREKLAWLGLTLPENVEDLPF